MTDAKKPLFDPDVRWTVSLTERQMQTVMNACEVYTRIALLQLDAVDNALPESILRDHEKHMEAREILREAEIKIKALESLHPSASLGVGNDKVGVGPHVAFDLYQSLRHHIWHFRHPDNPVSKFTVDAFPPCGGYSHEPIPEVDVHGAPTYKCNSLFGCLEKAEYEKKADLVADAVKAMGKASRKKTTKKVKK